MKLSFSPNNLLKSFIEQGLLLCKAVFLINSLRNFCRVLDNVLLCLKWLSYLIILFNI